MSTFYGDVPKLAKGSASKADRPGNRRGGSKSTLRSGRCWTKLHWSFSTPSSPLCSRSPSGRGNRFKPGQGRVQIPPGVHTLVPERNMDPAKDRRFAGSNPAKGIFGMWRNGRRAVLRPQSVRLRVRLPPYRLQGGLPQRKTGPVQTRFSEGSNPLSFIYNQQERGN